MLDEPAIEAISISKVEDIRHQGLIINQAPIMGRRIIEHHSMVEGFITAEVVEMADVDTLAMVEINSTKLDEQVIQDNSIKQARRISQPKERMLRKSSKINRFKNNLK